MHLGGTSVSVKQESRSSVLVSSKNNLQPPDPLEVAIYPVSSMTPWRVVSCLPLSLFSERVYTALLQIQNSDAGSLVLILALELQTSTHAESDSSRPEDEVNKMLTFSWVCFELLA